MKQLLRLIIAFPREWINAKILKLSTSLWMFRLKLAEDQSLNECAGDQKKRWHIRGEGFRYHTFRSVDLKKDNYQVRSMELDQAADSIVMWDSAHCCPKIIRKTQLVVTELKEVAAKDIT